MAKDKNYSSDWINELEPMFHWQYYWQQQNLIKDYIKKGDKILEIGVGTGFTSNYLKSKGNKVTTIDIDPEKKPDIIADIVNYDFGNKYDHILAFEVFEHIPYDDFLIVLENLAKSNINMMFISLPRNEKLRFRLSVDLKLFKIDNFQIFTKRNKIITKHHYWELDYKNYTKMNFLKQFYKWDIKLEKQFKYQSLYFFALKK